MFYVVGCMVKYAKRLFKAGDNRNEKILRLKVTSFICFIIAIWESGIPRFVNLTPFVNSQLDFYILVAIYVAED